MRKGFLAARAGMTRGEALLAAFFLGVGALLPPRSLPQPEAPMTATPSEDAADMQVVRDYRDLMLAIIFSPSDASSSSFQGQAVRAARWLSLLHQKRDVLSGYLRLQKRRQSGLEAYLATMRPGSTITFYVDELRKSRANDIKIMERFFAAIDAATPEQLSLVEDWVRRPPQDEREGYSRRTAWTQAFKGAGSTATPADFVNDFYRWESSFALRSGRFGGIDRGWAQIKQDPESAFAGSLDDEIRGVFGRDPLAPRLLSGLSFAEIAELSRRVNKIQYAAPELAWLSRKRPDIRYSAADRTIVAEEYRLCTVLPRFRMSYSPILGSPKLERKYLEMRELPPEKLRRFARELLK